MKYLNKLLNAVNSKTKIPAVKLVRDNPELAAMMSKLVTAKDSKTNYDNTGNKALANPDIFSMRGISDKIGENITDAETIMQLLPDMELWAQILISSILSPKDMMTTELIYNPPSDILPAEISSAIINIIKEHFETTYKIKPLLSKILKDVLFSTGSYPIAVIPENSIDELINGAGKISIESISNYIGKEMEISPLGILGPSVVENKINNSNITGISLESLNYVKTNINIKDNQIQFGNFNTKVYVNDNFNALKVPLINQRIRDQYINNAIGISALENQTKYTDFKISNLIYKNKQPTYKTLVHVKSDSQLSRRTVGEPLIIHFSSQSVIPVFVPGSPEKQIGFFILIDSEGNPINETSVNDIYGTLGNRLGKSTGTNFPSMMVDKVSSMMGSSFDNFDGTNRAHIDYVVKAYSELIETDLLNRLRNGIYGNGLQLSNEQDIYRIMLARTLQQQSTQLLFIPAELMTYFAFRFGKNGIGRSLIDEMKVLLSLRVMLMFSDVMASIKNSIGRTDVKIKLDEYDPDPKKTIQLAINEIIRTRQQNFPLGVNNPATLVDYLQRAGFEFTFEGHPGLPDVSVEFGEKNTNFTKVDTELEETLRKRSIMATGLNPETVDTGYGAEFATSVVANNILLSKRVIQIQDDYVPFISDHARKVILYSQPLTDKIKKILTENISKIKERLTEDFNKQNDVVIINQIYNDFVMGFEITLPAPNSVTLENQQAALKIYTESLEEGLDAYISDKFFTDSTGGEIANEVSVIREVIKARFIREWMSENGMLPELAALTATDEDGSPMINFFEEQSTHLESLSKSLTNLMVKLQQPKDDVSKTLQEEGITTNTSSPDNENTGGDNAGGDNEFGSDFGGSFDDTTSFGSTDTNDNSSTDTELADGGEVNEVTEPTEKKPEDETSGDENKSNSSNESKEDKKGEEAKKD